MGLLWFGWFGFNAGSALTADGKASVVFLNTLIAGCLGMLGWIFVERVRDGRPTTFGAASGVVAGLVAITPSCGFVAPIGAFVVGLAAGVVCSYAVGWKFKAGYDDSLDVVGVHFVGGVVGTFLIGLLAAEVVSGGVEGLFYGGGLSLLGKQTLAIPVVAMYAFVRLGSASNDQSPTSSRYPVPATCYGLRRLRPRMRPPSSIRISPTKAMPATISPPQAKK